METKIKGIITSKEEKRIIIMDDKNEEWTVCNLQLVHDVEIGFSQRLGRKVFIGNKLYNMSKSTIKETKVYIQVDISSQLPKSNQEFCGLKAEVFFD